MAPTSIREFRFTGSRIVNQVDCAINRTILMLLATNIVYFVKALLDGFVLTQVVMGLFTGLVLAAYIFALLYKSISLSIVPDLEHKIDVNYVVDWWNFYKHPLTVPARSKLDVVETEKCRFI